jgi:hypothetical protein
VTDLHIDICCGLGGWQAPFREDPAWRSVGIDINPDVEPDVLGDVRDLPIGDCDPTLVTASPPCTQFARWMLPWLDEPDPDLSLVRACLDAIQALNPDWWVLENSRGLHQFWVPARTHAGKFYLWGDWPIVDLPDPDHRATDHPGHRPDLRAKIPERLAQAVKRAVEVWS